MLDLQKVDKNWTLFVDRDGVINIEKKDDYIRHLDEFVFYPDAVESIRALSRIFGLIIIPTNQRGVGKGLMTTDDLNDIHEHMLRVLNDAGGRVDRIYYCSSLDDSHPFRKPNPGMALQAKKDFPQIDFSRSVMVGNTVSDMEFGRNAGMHTVFLGTTHPHVVLPHPSIDLSFNSLGAFVKALQES